MNGIYPGVRYFGTVFTCGGGIVAVARKRNFSCSFFPCLCTCEYPFIVAPPADANSSLKPGAQLRADTLREVLGFYDLLTLVRVYPATTARRPHGAKPEMRTFALLRYSRRKLIRLFDKRGVKTTKRAIDSVVRISLYRSIISKAVFHWFPERESTRFRVKHLECNMRTLETRIRWSGTTTSRWRQKRDSHVKFYSRVPLGQRRCAADTLFNFFFCFIFFRTALRRTDKHREASVCRRAPGRFPDSESILSTLLTRKLL